MLLLQCVLASSGKTHSQYVHWLEMLIPECGGQILELQMFDLSYIPGNSGVFSCACHIKRRLWKKISCYGVKPVWQRLRQSVIF